MAERLTTPLGERVKIADKEQAKKVVEQHEGSFTFSSFVHDAFEHGVLILSMLKGPDEQGKYGKYTGEQLARKLRPITVLLIDFLSEHGVIPSNLTPTIVSLQAPPPVMGAEGASTETVTQESQEQASEVEQPIVDQEETKRLGNFGVVSRKRKRAAVSNQEKQES